jgi:hypothetical protein
MSSLKILAAAVAAATVSLAFAQGTPPRPAADPAVGAGQRSTQNTPMGTTGTPGGTGAAAQGSTAGGAAASTGTSSSGSMNSGSASAGGSGSSSMASDTGSSSNQTRKSRKTAKADRN